MTSLNDLRLEQIYRNMLSLDQVNNIADINKTEEISKGRIYVVNNSCPSTFTNPTLLTESADTPGAVCAPLLKAATKTTKSEPPAITAAAFIGIEVLGSVSLLKFNIIKTKRNKTIIAPAYTMIFTIAKNCAFINT